MGSAPLLGLMLAVYEKLDEPLEKDHRIFSLERCLPGLEHRD